ncbi:MAG: bifunctional glutamate N-acetyltransferase/amino-acid acetyltransferase ArgJ [Nitrospirae bacterium]|nr:bifunctional glutamate N-acetyltransferase/amino-acid acetyltransferase ArgJ [Nitrospirota bacterium]
MKRDVDIPLGYRFSVAAAGIKYENRTDMALIYSEREAVAAGVFTTNRVKAAPVVLDMKRLRSATARAIVVNSGNANACTGQRGMKDAESVCVRISERLDIPEKHVLVASTGVIGIPLPMDRVYGGLEALTGGTVGADMEDVARAIMTTDKFPKFASRRIRIGKTDAVLSGMAKGAGMISPNMATMLCFLLTDLAVEKKTLKRTLREATDRTFNLITVDGDMSTNDTVIMMANGLAGNSPLTETSPGYRRFRTALLELMDELSRMIVKDGEGATRLMIIRLRGARNAADAKKAAFSVARSPLVKTAVYGRDANWGRIMAALGYSGAFIREDSIDISINGIKLVGNGLATGRDPEASDALKHGAETVIDINLKLGPASERVYTCDLTEEYVRINAAYRT